MNASDDLVLEHALLVSRGVRPMALVAYVGVSENEAREAHIILTRAVGSDRAIPFVVPWQEMECALAGFAAETWVIDLLEWICLLGVDSRRHHQVMGLLLGYSAKSIAEHNDIVFAGDPDVRAPAFRGVSLPEPSSHCHDNADIT